MLIAYSTFVVLLSRKIITEKNGDACLYFRGVHLMDIPAKTFIIAARQNSFIQEDVLKKSPVHRTAIAMNTNSAFTGSYSEHPLWCQQFDSRQIRIFRRGHSIVDFDTDDKCRLLCYDN